ncbi:MAG: hypothetical protein ABSD98_16990 [Candidatus Korobacteraceae bacterium]|jgi:hypothetical protein
MTGNCRFNIIVCPSKLKLYSNLSFIICKVFLSGMKQTEEDRRFARLFAEALLPHVEAERANGKSLAQIAARLGVTAAGLQKQLAGGTPSVRTVALAHAHYAIAIPYEGIAVSKAITAGRRRKGKQQGKQQLFLPFEISAPVLPNNVTLKLLPKGVRRYQLQLSMRISR